MQYAQIAVECKVSHKTVENTIAKARKRLNAATTAQAVVISVAREELGIDHNGRAFVPEYYE
jgi:DNA-binding CsgD family transcriptional regulator